MISSTPTMSLISAIGALDRITLTTNDVDTWYIDNVITAMENGEIAYVGDYKAPDFEMIASGNVRLAFFSSMVNNVPEVSDKFAELEIPLIVDQATFEGHPLARTEWVKLYGALFDLEDEAQAIYDSQVAVVNGLDFDQVSDKSVCVFYITSKGAIYARSGGDYLSKMTELAGGKYIMADVDPDKSGTVQMEPEAFYEANKDADYIIYIHSLGGKPENIEQFIEKNEILAEFKAVQEGNVWCTTPDFFQIVDVLGNMVGDINSMLTTTDDSVDSFTYLFKLK